MPTSAPQAAAAAPVAATATAGAAAYSAYPPAAYPPVQVPVFSVITLNMTLFSREPIVFCGCLVVWELIGTNVFLYVF